MGLDKTKKSNRLLASRRYTMEQSTDAQEAFTRVLDLNATEIYTQEAAIPSASLEYSGSSQDQQFVTSGSENILKYYHEFQLTPSNVVNGSKSEVYFFISKSGHDPNIAVTPQVIQDGQQGSFISPKYSIPALTNADAEDATPGYNVVIKVNGTKQNPSFYQFDYKTGVIQFVDQNDAPTTGDTVRASIYQYVGKTLDESLISGSGTGVGFPFTGSAQITGSLGLTGSQANLIQSSENFIIKNATAPTQSLFEVKGDGVAVFRANNTGTPPSAVLGGLYFTTESAFLGVN